MSSRHDSFASHVTPRSRRPGHAGVTLIETVLAIVVLASAAAIGTFLLDNQWNARRQVEADRVHLMQVMNVVRRTAISQQASVRVTMNAARPPELLITQAAGPVGPTKQWTIPLGTTSEITMSDREVTFDPAGDANHDLEIRIDNDSSHSDVTVAAINGAVR